MRANSFMTPSTLRLDEAVAGAAALLKSGDDRLGGAHALGELDLRTEAGLSAQVVDELTEREVVFDPGLTAALLA
jgi:hypothetical protein